MKTKICLSSPPSRSINHYRPPVALLYLAGYLEKNGYEVDIVDITLKNQIRNKNFFIDFDKNIKSIENKILEGIRQLNPDIVGITCYTPEFYEVLSLAKEIKNYNPKIKIIVGGIHPTFYPQDFIYKASPFDFAVLGEGELTLLDLCKHINQPKKYSQIKSIAYFDDKVGKMFTTSKRPLEENLDKIANPAYHLIDMDYYTTANPYAIRGVFTRCAYILSSRGCPSMCTFCVSKKIREFSGSKLCARLRTPKNLFQEIKLIKEKYQIDSFYFIDDLFTLNKQHVKEFCLLLKKSKLGFIWGCSSKVTTVDYQTLKIMKESGCIQIDFGVERGSNHALSLIKKGLTVEIIKRVFSDCHKLGIRTFANMLINLPEETEDDLNDILNLLDEIRATIVSINIFTPYPGTEIYDTAKRLIIKKDYPNLMRNIVELIKKEPGKYKFYLHNINIGEWSARNNKKYNYILPMVLFYLKPVYLRNLLKSSRKLNYLSMAGLLIREFINQKF